MKIADSMIRFLEGELNSIGDRWIDSPVSRRILEKLMVEPHDFLKNFGYEIIHYMFLVMEENEAPGDCPYMRQLLDLFSHRNLSISSVFQLCMALRYVVLDTATSSGFPAEEKAKSTEAIHEIFDLNLGGLLDIYSSQIAERKMELDREIRMNQEMRTMLELQNRQAMIGEMMGSVSHQWKQPLNTLSILIQDMQESLSFDDTPREDSLKNVEDMLLQISKMNETVEFFRDFYRPRRETEIFSLNEVIHRVRRFLEHPFRISGIAIDFQEECTARIQGFPNEIEQVLFNLMGNARDAILENNRAPGSIVLRLFRTNSHIHLLVQDNGGGIRPEIMEKLFRPYTTTKREGGTGIGLYLAKEIVENRLKGWIHARNNDEGAVFEIELVSTPGLAD